MDQKKKEKEKKVPAQNVSAQTLITMSGGYLQED